MKKEKIGFELLIFDDASELSQNEQKLLKQAAAARQDAYAPYSKFKVGAAVLLENGEVVIGNNQENASYPSGLCAERVAIFHAGAKYPGVPVKAIAISASSSKEANGEPAAPCGNCRQSIIEYEQKQKSPISLLLSSETGPIYKCNSTADILPLAFNSSFLGDS
ncbi:MAG: cytidine deaminase [Bacteroidota bacterium]|uniref:Cytidine deaminase n=1 Tax=Flagellimonas profundi TaxID=2915620 RepID=A0ABS3FJR3_9FLAO|nr:cytidine deaminase [Allomuricauda profundi]MBO0343440.1 cytidine deaminase [Allomuricauda profundi]MEC7772308.1 cytidine deaminase [Bacteroidota bacterium]